MEEHKKTSRQYPAKDGGTISGDRVHGLPSTRDYERTATCASVQGVPSQGTLDSMTTCGISEPPEQGGPAHTRQLAAMPNPASRRERRKLAAAAKAASTKPPQTCGGTTEGSTAALSTTPQDSGQIGDIVTLTGTTATGGAEADDRMDVAQSFSSSEAETSEEETVDEDTLLCSPLEQEIETGTAPSCSAEASTSGAATGHKRKTEGGPTPPQASRKKKRKRGHTLGATFKQAEEQDLLGVVLVKGQPYKTLSRPQINWIRAKLLTTMLEKAKAGGDAPVFEESGVRHNRFHLSCTDYESYAWLKDTVGSLNIEGDGEGETLALELVPASEVPRLLRAEVFVSGPPIGVPNFITLIQSQNKTVTYRALGVTTPAVYRQRPVLCLGY